MFTATHDNHDHLQSQFGIIINDWTEEILNTYVSTAPMAVTYLTFVGGRVKVAYYPINLQQFFLQNCELYNIYAYSTGYFQAQIPNERTFKYTNWNPVEVSEEYIKLES